MTDLVVTRTFDAPREQVFRAWADPVPRARWSPPAEPAFPDVTPEVLLAGEADGMRLRVEFHDEAGGRTRLVLTQGPCPPETDGAAREAWSASFTRLDRLLSRPPSP